MIVVKGKIFILVFVILFSFGFVDAYIDCQYESDGWYCDNNVLVQCLLGNNIFENDCGLCVCSASQGDCDCTNCEFTATNILCLTPAGGSDWFCDVAQGEFYETCCSTYEYASDGTQPTGYYDGCQLACDAAGGDCSRSGDPELLDLIQNLGAFPSLDHHNLIMPQGYSSYQGAVWKSCDMGAWFCENYCLGVWDSQSEKCGCNNGETRSCYTGPAGTSGIGLCSSGTQTCIGGVWNNPGCSGQIVPSNEICTGGEDEDCDGDIDCGDLADCENDPACDTADCGNGAVEIGEDCDDGNEITETECDYGTSICEACSADCGTVLSLTGPYCDDGVTDAGYEDCDNGGLGDNCDCLADCTDPGCGDGQICPPEVCESNSDCNEAAGETCNGCNSCEVPVGSCTIIDSYWSETDSGPYSGNNIEITEGETTYLIVEGSIGCEGQMVQFSYYDWDPINNDDISFPSTYGLPSIIFFPAGSTQISKILNPLWMDPGDEDPDGVPEVKFLATTEDDTDRANNQLIINQAPPMTCQITDHYWTNISDGTKVPGTDEDIRVDHGEEVYLVVEGTNCGGKSGTLQYWDQDLVLDPITSPGDYGLPISFTFGPSATRVIKNYDAQYYYADSGVHSGPEYVFKATIGAVQTNDISNELIVDELGDCEPTYNCCDATETCVTGHPGYYCSGGESCCEDCTVGGGACQGELCDSHELCGDTNSSWETDTGCEQYCNEHLNLRCYTDLGSGRGRREIQSDCVEDGDSDNIGVYNITYIEFNISNVNQIFSEIVDTDLPCFLDQDIPFFDSFGIGIVLFILVGFYFTKRKSFKKN